MLCIKDFNHGFQAGCFTAAGPPGKDFHFLGHRFFGGIFGIRGVACIGITCARPTNQGEKD